MKNMIRNGLMTGAVTAAGYLMAGTPGNGVGIWQAPAIAPSDGAVVVYEDEPTGRISPQNGVCGAPDLPRTANHAAWKKAEFPYSRTHDMNNNMGYGAPHIIDVPAIFPNFEADENDPKSYDFACTDVILHRMIEAGVEPFYRLGGSFESYLVKHYTTFPPRDFAKWTRIVEHIVAHYTEGWANGFRWKMEHWEFWNEPDLLPRKKNGKYMAFWDGTRDEFTALWKMTMKHLKARFPHLKFGGPAVMWPVGKWVEEIIQDLAKDKTPLDFYSWHNYSSDPRQFGDLARQTRKMLDSYGYTNTIQTVNEWNYVSGWGAEDLRYSRSVWLGDHNYKGAAYIAASMIEMDAAGVDIGMFYDARRPGMNALFDPNSGVPMRGYYPFIAWRNLRRLGTRVKTTCEIKEGVWTVAAKGADGRLGILLVCFNNDDNVYKRKRVTLKLASGASLADATCHLTDRDFIYTAHEPEVNADGSIDLMMDPCSFVYVETARDLESKK